MHCYKLTHVGTVHNVKSTNLWHVAINRQEKTHGHTHVQTHGLTITLSAYCDGQANSHMDRHMEKQQTNTWADSHMDRHMDTSGSPIKAKNKLPVTAASEAAASRICFLF